MNKKLPKGTYYFIACGFFSANDPWNPVSQGVGGMGLGSHPDSAFSAMAVTSKFSGQNDPW